MRTTTRSDPSQDPVRIMLVWIIVGIGTLGLGVLLVLVLSEPAPIEGLRLHNRPARGHDNQIVFADSDLPPPGGVHQDIWQNCGIYDAPVETARAVHSMEHGAVWITYRPVLPADDLQVLRRLVQDEPYLLLSPYPGLRSPVVLTAWGVQLELPSVHDPRIEQFIRRYRLGPTTPERGASCSGGAGTPLNLRS